MNLAIETKRYILRFGQLLPVHPHNMVSLISNWFILSPTERSPNSCSVIAAQPTSKFHPPHPIFIQVDYMYKYIQTPSPHLYTGGLQAQVHITPLTPFLHGWTTCTSTYNPPHHIFYTGEVHLLPTTPLLKSPHLYTGALLVMYEHPSNPPYSAALHAGNTYTHLSKIVRKCDHLCKFVLHYTYFQWPRSSSKRAQKGLKGGDRSCC